MSWNFRIAKWPDECTESGYTYSTVECYYDDDGKPWGWSENPRPAYGDTPEGLIESLKTMLSDVEKSKDDIIDTQAVPTGKFEDVKDG
jgi:hypothetical protein